MHYFWVLNMVWLHPFPHTENYNLFLLSVISDLFALSVEKRPIFEPKQAMNKEHHISLYSQFVVVLHAIIFFFLVPFCDNSLLVLKMRFQVFSLARKNFFQWQKDINVVVISVFSSTKLCLSFSKVLFSAKVFYETFIMSLKSTSFPKELWWKSFISRANKIKRNLRPYFVDERQMKMIIPK